MMGALPAAKPGRNDACSCGSGKKYKRCCLMSQQASQQNSPWLQQRRAADRLSDEMLKFARQRFGDRIDEAWQDFNEDDFPGLMDKFPGEEQIFFPYLFYDWDPDRPRLRRGPRPKPGIIARGFLQERARRLADLERAILEQGLSQPTSFYEVMRCDRGHGMRLRDVLIGGEVEVEEHAGSQCVQQGDMVYAQLCRLPDVTTMGRMAPTAIPPRRKADVVALRAWLRQKVARESREPAVEDLFRYADKIRLSYLNIRDSLHAPPRLVNTDGDPLEFHTLSFRVGSAQVAFDALAPLSRGRSKQEMLEDADVDQDGTLRKVEVDWIKKGNKVHKNWDNTILGHMKIAGSSLVVEVNSANRAAKIRREIEDRLGMMTVHLGTRVRTAEQMMEAAKERKTATPPQPEDPQLKELNRAFRQQQMEAWIHQEIPILQGRTPMEAVGDPDGREIVESLLLDWERNNERHGESGMSYFDVDNIRRLLNLPTPATSK
jgi:SEC-C motif